MSESGIEPLPDGDGTLGDAEGPADAGAGDLGSAGEHDGERDGEHDVGGDGWPDLFP